MKAYDIQQFAKLVDKSVRTVRRYISDGKAPNGMDWKPTKDDGKYIFHESDVHTWQSDKPEIDSQSNSNQSNISIDVNALFAEMKGITSELAQAKGQQLALTSQSESLSNDYEKIKAKYLESMAKIKQLEIENQQLKEQLEKLKNRKLFQRIFDA